MYVNKLNEDIKKLKEITENSPHMIYQYREDGTPASGFTYVSKACQSIFEVESGELIKDPAPAFEIIHPEDKRSFLDLKQKNDIKPEPLVWEGRITGNQTGEVKWVRIASEPVIQDDGVVIWHGIVEDITDQKRLHFELEEARERAERLARYRQEFLATMSHEIRTPLHAILGLTELLRENNPRQDQTDNLDSLFFSADNLMNLVNNLLDLSKMEAGKLPESPVRFDLKEALGNIHATLLPHAEKNGNQLELSIDQSLPEQVRADKVKLLQVLSNLLHNALKFTRNGTVQLSAAVVQQSASQVDVQFKVTDTGPGISEENLKMIFDQFSQMEQSATRRAGGSGLGLYLVRKLLKSMDSEIRAASELGKGAQFYFELSFDKVLEKATQETIRSETDDLGPCKILMGEDLKENRDILKQYFHNWAEIEVDFANDGQQVIDMISRQRYDLLLLDIRMPEVNGHQAAAHIRSMEDQHYSKVPIIALTADMFAAEESNGDFNDIILKPFKFKELKEKILQYIS